MIIYVWSIFLFYNLDLFISIGFEGCSLVSWLVYLCVQLINKSNHWTSMQHVGFKIDFFLDFLPPKRLERTRLTICVYFFSGQWTNNDILFFPRLCFSVVYMHPLRRREGQGVDCVHLPMDQKQVIWIILRYVNEIDICSHPPTCGALNHNSHTFF